MSVTVDPVAGHIGAVIDGVDLRDPGDELAGVVDALHTHEVVFFRNADLSEDEQMALGRRLGSPSVFPMARIMGATEPRMTVIEDGPDNPIRTDHWHTDVTWIDRPPKYALLQALAVPERGGDTMWVSCTAVYEALSPAMQEFLAGLTVIHDNESFIGGVRIKMGDERAEELDIPGRLRAEYPPVVHPLVRTHPDTGRRALLWGGRFMRRIVELSDEESVAVMGFLEARVNDPRFQVRWQWEPGDLAVWDERSTAHRSAGDHGEQRRAIRRLEIDGDRPYLDPETIAG